jgi:hypothetical protein
MLGVNGALTRVDVRHNNIAGDGAAQLAAAVLGNLKIEVFNKIPIKEMRANSITELDLNGKDVGVEGGMVVAGLIPVMAALTVTNLLGNWLDAESTKMLTEVAKQKGISLCGIQRDQTTADFSYKDICPHAAILLASDLSQAVVTGALTGVDVRHDGDCLIAGDAAQLSAAVLGNLKIEMFNGIPIKEMRANSLTITKLDLNERDVGVLGGMVVAGLIPVMGALTKLSLAHNNLEEEGIFAICEALEQNTTLKELNISGGRHGNNIGGSAGAKHVAKMVGINGSLTRVHAF